VLRSLLLDGSYAVYPGVGAGSEMGNRLYLQVGANSNQNINVSIPDFTTDSMVSHCGFDIFSPYVEMGSVGYAYSMPNQVLALLK